MSSLLSFSLWDWVELGGLAMVFIGVLFGHIATKNNSPRKDFWEMVLIIGLAIDVSAFVRHEKQLADLKHENLLLELRLQPRKITDKQVRDFIFLTERIPKIAVRVDVGSGVFNQETCNFAFEIRELLQQAKFLVPESDQKYSMNVFNEPSRTFISKDGPTDLIMFVESSGLTKPQFEMVNGIKRPVAQNGNTNDIYAALYYAFSEAGISIGLVSKPEWTHDTHMEIFVREKP